MRAEGAGRSVIVLDEPTTGLHASDVERLARVLRSLADRGDAVCVIEHHTDLLAVCDRLVELGPAGGLAGGQLIASGTPEELMQNPDSVTGPFLVPASGTKARGKGQPQRRAKARAGGKS